MRRNRRGFILLDVLSTLLIASTALLLILGGLSLSARVTGEIKYRVLRILESRNQDAQFGETVLSEKLLER
jgi:hypothetical protein